MADQRASGKLVYDIEVNTANAFKSVSQLKGQFRSVRKEWKNHYQILMANNKQYEAMDVKAQGLKDEQEALNRVVKQGEKALDALREQAGNTTTKENKLKQEVNNATIGLEKNKEQQQSVNRVMKLFSQEVRDATKAQQNQTKQDREQIKTLQNQGREYDVQQAKIKAYGNRIDTLSNQAKSLEKAMSDYAKETKYTQEQLNNDQSYQKQKSRHSETIAQLNQAKRGYNDLRLGINDLNDYSKQYNETTKSLVARLKEESGAAIANKESYERLSEQRKLDIKQHYLQVEKMKDVANASGEDSKAYQEEVRKLNELDRAFHNHSVKLNEAGKGYENMSDKQARAYDKTAKRADSLDKFSTGAMNMAHRMTTGSIAVGTMFGYGMQQASQLEDSYVKTSNLMKTAGEDQQEVHHNVTQMQSDAKKYAIQYGESQQDIANGYQELTRRGYDSQQALSSNKSYLDASIASGDKYNDVIETGASAIEGFGKRSDNAKEMTKNTKEVLNQMAYAADLSASDFNSLGDSMRYVSSTSRHANQDVSTTSSAIGILSNAGEKGSTAGTGLRQVLDRFTSVSTSGRSQQGKILEKLGLSKQDFQDQHGRLKNIADLFDIMNSHMQGFSDSDKADMFHGFFGTTGQESAKILSGNVQGLRDLNGQVSKAQDQNNGKGYIADLAEKNMQSTQAQFNRARESIKLASQTIAESLMPAAKWGAEHLANLGDNLRKMPGWGKMLIGGIAVVIPTIAALGYAVGGVTRGFQLFHRAINGSRSLYARLTGRHHKVQTRIEKEAEAYDLNTAAVKRNTRAKEVNDGTGGGSGGPSSGSGSSYGSSYDGYSSSGSSRKGRSRSASREAGTLSRTEREAGTASRSASREAGTLSKVGRGASEAGMFSKALSFGGKATAGLAILSQIPELLSANKNNYGSKLGDAGGSLAGGAAGASAGAITGSAVPVVGTAAGGIIGGGIGTVVGSPAGAKAGDYIQKHSSQQGLIPNLIRKDNKERAGTDYQKQAKGAGSNDIVSELAQSQVRSNARDNNDNSQSSVNMVKQNQDTYSKMKGQLDDYNQHAQSKSKSNLEYLASIGAISQKSVQKRLDKENEAREKNKGKAKSDIDEMIKVEDQGGKARSKAMSKAQRSIAKSLSNSSDTQKIVLGQLQSSTKKISDKQAGQLISSSYKSMRSQVRDANKTYNNAVNKANRKYKKTTDKLNEERYVSGTISQKKYDEQMRNAEKEKNDSVRSAGDQKKGIVDQARDQHEKVVSEAKQQSDDHLKHINEETGQGENMFQKFGEHVRNIFHSLTSFLGDFWKNNKNTIKHLGFSDLNIGGKNVTPSKQTKGWGDDVKNSLKSNGLSSSKEMQNRILRQIQTESNGDPNAIGGDDGDKKSGNATGLMQVKPATFNQYKKKGQNINNPQDNLDVAIRYAKHRYGKDLSYLGQGHGYANGGWSNKPAIFGEIPGQPEIAINPKRKSADKWIGEAIQARAKEDNSSKWAKMQSSIQNMNSNQSGLTDNSKVVQMLTRSLEFITQKVSSGKSSSNSNDDEYVKRLVEDNKRKDKRMVAMLDKMDNLISAIENKPTISDTQIYKANRRQTHTQQKQQNMLQGGF